MSGNGLIKVDDRDAVDGERALAGINEAIKDGLDVGGVGSLVVGSGGVDGEADNNEATSDVGAGPDATFGEAEGLSVGVGGGVGCHVN